MNDNGYYIKLGSLLRTSIHLEVINTSSIEAIMKQQLPLQSIRNWM